MNTLIINKLILHMLDFEHGEIHYSDELTNITDTNTDYFHTKLEKAYLATNRKKVVVGSLHDMMLRGDKMIESDEEFIAQSKDIAQKLYSLGRAIEDMPNSNVIFAECFIDGVRYILILKLNYRHIPMTVIEEGLVRITRRQVMPLKGSPVDEAILIDMDEKEMSLIEKKYTIDGKMDFYLNAQWIKGEESLTDKQKFSSMKRVITKLDDIYNVNEGKALPLMKQELFTKCENNETIKPLEVVRKVLEKDYQAQEESEIMMKDLGIDENAEMSALAFGNVATCKLVLDNDIEVVVPVTEYLAGNVIEKVIQADGKTQIVIKDISEIIVK